MDQVGIANEQAKENARREREHRQRVQAANKRFMEQRRAQAQVAEATARTEEQARLRADVRRWFMIMNAWASEKDFDAFWQKDKLTLIREHRTVLSNMPRM